MIKIAGTNKMCEHKICVIYEKFQTPRNRISTHIKWSKYTTWDKNWEFCENSKIKHVHRKYIKNTNRKLCNFLSSEVHSGTRKYLHLSVSVDYITNPMKISLSVQKLLLILALVHPLLHPAQNLFCHFIFCSCSNPKKYLHIKKLY